MNQTSNLKLEYEILKRLALGLYSPDEIAEDLGGHKDEIRHKFVEFREKKIIENYYADQYVLSTDYKKILIKQALEQIYENVTIVTNKKTFDKVLDSNLIESNPESKHDFQTIDAINIYRAGGSQSKYYRYSFYENGKIKHHHIKGGNIHNPLVDERVTRLKRAIASGQTHNQILSMIKSW